jgi:hypothetical protein
MTSVAFTYGSNGVTLFELQFIRASTRDRALDQVIADTNDHVGHDVAEFNFLDCSPQFISG